MALTDRNGNLTVVIETMVRVSVVFQVSFFFLFLIVFIQSKIVNVGELFKWNLRGHPVRDATVPNFKIIWIWNFPEHI